MKTVLLYTINLENAQIEIKNQKGHVTQILTQNVLLTNFPDDFKVSQLEYSTTSIPNDIDEMSQMFIDGWNSSDSIESEEILPWDNDTRQYPKNANNNKELAEQALKFPTTTSDYMVGTISVGLVVVSGPNVNLKFNQLEKQLIVKQVMKGLQALADFGPTSKITFEYENRFIDIDIEPTVWKCSNDELEKCEKIWRDPTLQKLGVLSSGMTGVKEYNEYLISEKGTQWSFTAFITKYPLGHSAYASSGRMCIKYDNATVKAYGLDSVVAHEVCHLFGAADEYKKACKCKESGFFNVPNNNCVYCTNYPTIPCLMIGTGLGNLCQWTRGQLGWDYAEISLDLANGSFNYFYDTAIPFTEGNKTYMFAQTSNVTNHWFISELTANGISSDLASGNWNKFYGTIIPFTFGGRAHMFAHTAWGNNWFISRLTANGISSDLANGKFNYFYDTAIPFTIENKTYMFAQTSNVTNHWFISELTANGISSDLAKGNWNKSYGTIIPFTIGNRAYMFAHTAWGNNWFISRLTANGISSDLANGKFNYFYDTAIPFTIGNKTYMFAQTSNVTNHWFIAELTANGISSDLASGNWKKSYGTIIPFTIDTKTYLFAHTVWGNNWFISEISAGEGAL